MSASTSCWHHLWLVFVRTPSKQKSPKKDEEINIVELLRGHDPKDYERILQEHGIHDYRAILQAVEFLKREKEMETGRVVWEKTIHLNHVSENLDAFLEMRVSF